jgi:hypothetical protein
VLNLPRRAPTLRLGLWGVRGGVGVSTAIALLARDLVKSGMRVIVFDAPRRGDVALYLDGTPSDQPQTIQGIMVYPARRPKNWWRRIPPFSLMGAGNAEFQCALGAGDTPLKENELLALWRALIGHLNRGHCRRVGATTLATEILKAGGAAVGWTWRTVA